MHGDADATVNVQGSRTMVAKAREFGIDVKYIEVPGGTHGGVVAPNLAAMFEFFDAHTEGCPEYSAALIKLGPKFEPHSERTSKVRRRRRVIAVPILDASVLGLQEPEKAAVGAVPETMASRFDGVAWLQVVGRDTNPLEPGATGRFESPHLRLAFLVLDFEVDPGVRDDQVHFLDDALSDP